MKNLTFGTAMALSVFANTAHAEGNAPTMIMDEMVVKNQTMDASMGTAGTLIPIILVFLLIAIAAAADDGGMMSYAE